MRAPAGVLLGAEIDEAVPWTIAHEAPRLVTQRPAGVETEDRAARAGGLRPRPLEVSDTTRGELHRGGRRLLERRRRANARRRRAVIPEQTRDDRLPRLDSGSEHGIGGGRRGRLRDDEHDPRIEVGAQGRDTLQGGQPADGGVEIPPARADRVGDPRAEAMDEAGQLLDPCSRGADDADGTAAHPVREAQADSVDDRGPAFGAHDQKPAIARPALERHLVIQ